MRQAAGPNTIETIRLRDVGPGDIRVRIDATGVCHSDLSLARGKLAQPTPAVLGHEACGTVLEVGPGVASIAAGQRVILLWINPCGECFFCTNGERYLCERGSSRAGEPYAIDAQGEPVYAGLGVGAFAEQTVVPASGAVVAPDFIAPEHAALLGCAVATGVGAATKAAAVRAGSSVLVLGLGGVGLSAIMGAKLAGAGLIIGVDRNRDKAAIAATVGAHQFLPADDQLKSQVRALTDGRGVDFAFDCVGSATTIRDAWTLSRRGGTACIVGIGGRDESVTFTALELFHFARTLVACLAGSIDISTELPRLFEWVRSGELDLAPLVTRHARLDELDDAFAELAQGHAVRTMIRPGG
jgi:S-(hydroxymethyl)glutathione dehydrogenase/alcohol dehydrogenase